MSLISIYSIVFVVSLSVAIWGCWLHIQTVILNVGFGIGLCTVRNIHDLIPGEIYGGLWCIFYFFHNPKQFKEDNDPSRGLLANGQYLLAAICVEYFNENPWAYGVTKTIFSGLFWFGILRYFYL